MSDYNHFTLSEREMLSFFLCIGLNISEIAKLLEKNKSTISRELKRNSTNGVYKPRYADEYYEKRRKTCKPKGKAENTKLIGLVKELLYQRQWSPEQIAGRLKFESNDTSKQISKSTIYRMINKGQLDSKNIKAKRKLRHKGKRRHSKGFKDNRGHMPISNDLTKRPADANKRKRKGHWEADTVLGIIGGKCLVTLTDRKTRLLCCKLVNTKKAEDVYKAIIELLKDKPVFSITPDRGKEFAKHHLVTKG